MVSRSRMLALAAILVLATSWCRADIAPEVVIRAKQATALVNVVEHDGVSEGSAFCIDATGLFITNAHVIESVEAGVKLFLVLHSGEKDQLKVPAHVVIVDKEADLAILQAETRLIPDPLALGTTENLVETTSVVAFGYPFGSDLAAKEGDFPSISVSMGHITALRKVKGELTAIQLDASLNPGNSGGPVLNSKGEVIGIVKEGIAGSGVNFAIPVAYLRTLLAHASVIFVAPVVTREHLLEPQTFTIQLLNPPHGSGPVKVRLNLSADEEDIRSFQAASTDGRTFTVQTPLLPVRKGPADLQITIRVGRNQFTGHMPDQYIRVKGEVVALSRVSRIETGGNPRVTLLDERVIQGNVTGLSAIQVQVGAANTTLRLGQIDALQISPPVALSSVDYHITVLQGDRMLGDLAGKITLTDASALIAVNSRPRGVAGYEIVVSCLDSNDIRRFDAQSGAYISDFAVGNGLKGPQDMLWGPDGNLYISSAYTHSVRRFDGRTGQFIDAFVKDGSGGLNDAAGMAWGSDGNLYVASHWTKEVKRYNGKTGAFIDNFVVKGAGGLDRPSGIRFGPDGNLYVASFAANLIKRYDGRTGAYIDDFAGGSGLRSPGSIEWGPDGYLYVCSCDSSEVKRYDGTTGAFVDNLITAKSGGLDYPFGLLFAPDGKLYVSSKTNTIKRYDGKTGAYLDDFIGGDGMVYPERMLYRRKPAP